LSPFVSCFFPEITLDTAELNTDNDKDCADTQSLSDNLPQHLQNADGCGGSGASPFSSARLKLLQIQISRTELKQITP
jgi:hypothetical protein